MMRATVPANGSYGARGDFEDGLLRRYSPAAQVAGETPWEILCFRREISDVPAFELATRARLTGLSDFHHPCFVCIRKIDRLNDEYGTVTLLVDGADGDRVITGWHADGTSGTDNMAPDAEVLFVEIVET